jgi:Ser/Thr protein kinase RdoA (MazF antagonist)
MGKPRNVIEEFSARVYARLGGTTQPGPWTPAPPAATKRVSRHLEQRYGIRVKRMSPIDSGFRVDRHNGPSWVARWFPPARPREVVEGDAEILEFLEENGFPAERLAHREPISEIEGFRILVTEFVEGGPFQQSGQHVHRLGELHGRLHTFPVDEGARARDAGSWHLLSIEGGTRRVDVQTLMPLLAAARQGAPREHKAMYDTLRAELEAIDHCEDLPHALISIDFGGPNVIDSPERGLVGVDWAGAGRGPRLFGLAALVNGRRDLRLVDAFIDGYRKHVRLEPDELARLAPALRVHSLILDCWGAVFVPARVADTVARIGPWRELTESIAERAREACRAGVIGGFEEVPPPPPMEDAFQVLVSAVKGKSDEEIRAFADSIGGYAMLCRLVFQGMRARLVPAEDCNVGFVLGDDIGWVFRSSNGTVTVAKRVAKRAGAIVRATPADFLRVITQELSWEDAVGQGRVRVEGDEKQVSAVFASRRS